MYICTFKNRFPCLTSNTTKKFWFKVVNQKILKRIFKAYKSETLGNYWQIIGTFGNNDKFLVSVNNNLDYINDSPLRLLSIINIIPEYVNKIKKKISKYSQKII